MRNPFAQSILDQIEIVDLISEDVTLEGNKAPCPFPDHNDANPSFTVYAPDSFYCFGCSRGGTAIDYVMYRDGVTAGEAIRILCAKYNIPMPDWTPEQHAEYERRLSEKEIVSKINADAFAFYHDNMIEEQRAYFLSRGLTNETIDKEKLGYAPEGNVLFAHLNGKYAPDQLLISGLFIKVSGGIKDFYRDRYVFPYWHRGQIAYSIGRSLNPDIEEHKKYIKQMTHKKNHPYVSDTVQNIIWNADEVRAFKRGSIPEGIVDGLHAKQIGDEINCGVISPVTKQFRGADIDSLIKLTKAWETTFIFPDNEESGEGLKGALKTARTLFEAGRDVRLVMLPRPDNVEKVDLADFLNVPSACDRTRDDQRDARIDELNQLMNEALNFIEWKINEVADLPERDRPGACDRTRKATREIFSLLANVDDELELEHYADLMQKAKLVKGKRLFWKAWKQTRIEEAKKHKQEQMKLLESESPELFLKAQVQEARKNKYGKAFEIKQNVSSIIRTDMLERGRFYRSRTECYYYFNNDNNTLCEIGDRTFEYQTNTRYQLNRTEEEYKYLVAELEAEAGLNGKLTDVYRFAHYNTETHILYVDRNDNQLYRLNGDTIELVSNGTDGVLFISDISHEPFKIVDIGDKQFIDSLIIKPTNFMQSEHVNLNKQGQETLLNVWIHTLFFEELQPTKPILTFIGEKGSGKTTRQKSIGKWLIGKEFNVQGINEEDDFLATITNNYLASFDNVDTYKKWLNDRLAQVATGQRIEKRELYTTNKIARYYPRCFVTLNSREPKFRRDDVVDRLLLFKVERLEHFKSEARILQEIADNRDNLWSELLRNLNIIVNALREDGEPFTSSYRMADFAELGWRIAKAGNAGDLWLELLDKMQKERSEFLLFEDPIYQVIHCVLSSGHTLEDMTSRQLYSVFKEYAEKDDIEFSYIKSAMSLGKKLGHLLNELQEYFDIKRRKDKTGWHYTIRPKGKESEQSDEVC